MNKVIIALVLLLASTYSLANKIVAKCVSPIDGKVITYTSNSANTIYVNSYGELIVKMRDREVSHPYHYCILVTYK